MASPLTSTLTLIGRSGADWDVTVVRQSAAEAPADPALQTLGEAELVAACLEQRSGAFDVIVDRHQRAVYQICYTSWAITRTPAT